MKFLSDANGYTCGRLIFNGRMGSMTGMISLFIVLNIRYMALPSNNACFQQS